MNIEESIIEFKKMIERDKDTLRYWKSDTFGHYDEPIKKLEKDVLISETLLTAYEKEKEKNSKLLEALDTVNHEKSVFIESYEKEKEKNKRIIKELEKHIKFCEQEAEGSLNNEVCHISLKFNKKLLNILKREE